MNSWLIVYRDDDCQQLVEKKYRDKLPDVDTWKYDEEKLTGDTIDAPRVKLPGFAIEWNKPVRSVRC
jgi:hypothetical protein